MAAYKCNEEWESYKETIRTLYLIEDQTLQVLMDIMKTKYSFEKT